MRVKTLEYNKAGDLEEIDLGPLPSEYSHVPLDGYFFFSCGGKVYPHCYIGEEDGSIVKGFGVAFAFVVFLALGLLAIYV